MKELIRLMNENPELEIVPMVSDNFVGGEDTFSMGKICGAEIDQIFREKHGKFYLRSKHSSKLLSKIHDEVEDEKYAVRTNIEQLKQLEDVMTEVIRRCEKIKWEKVIIVWIGVE